MRLKSPSAPHLRHPPKRGEFAANLLEEDLGKLAQWHSSRPEAEQQRFLQGIDALYKAAANSAGGNDDASIEAISTTASEPCLAAAATAIAPSAEAGVNSFTRWLADKNSSDSVVTCSETSGASVCQRFSDVTRTPRSSTTSGRRGRRGSSHVAHFRRHPRGFAANRTSWEPVCSRVHQAKAGHLRAEGVPREGFPDFERMRTSAEEVSRRLPLGELSGQVAKSQYEGVLKEGQQPFIEQYLANASSDERRDFKGMVRSLQALNRTQARQCSSVARQELDLQQNKRLYSPARPQPLNDASTRNASRVPLGALPIPFVKAIRPQEAKVLVDAVTDASKKKPRPASALAASVNLKPKVRQRPHSAVHLQCGGPQFRRASATGDGTPEADGEAVLAAKGGKPAAVRAESVPTRVPMILSLQDLSDSGVSSRLLAANSAARSPAGYDTLSIVAKVSRARNSSSRPPSAPACPAHRAAQTSSDAAPGVAAAAEDEARRLSPASAATLAPSANTAVRRPTSAPASSPAARRCSTADVARGSEEGRELRSAHADTSGVGAELECQALTRTRSSCASQAGASRRSRVVTQGHMSWIC